MILLFYLFVILMVLWLYDVNFKDFKNSTKLYETYIDENESALSLCWKNDGTKLLCSGSKGKLYLYDCNKNNGGISLSLTKEWLAHDNIEVWNAAIDYHDTNIVYSGADDAIFKAWDIRLDCSYPILNQQRAHTAGVTVISPHHNHEYLIATGSYDENVRLWDRRNLKKIINEYSVGGGVWRLRWHPKLTNYILCAAMHNGFSVLKLDEKDQLKSYSTFTDHESLAYGCDWNINNNELDDLIVSCSFYDKKVCSWTFKI